MLSIQIIDELSLYASIFDVPASVALKLPTSLGPSNQGLAAASVLHVLTESSDSFASPLPSVHPTLVSAFRHDSSTPPRLYLACALTPYRHVTYTDAKSKTHPAVEAALREGVKLGMQNHYLDGISALFSSADLLQNPQIGGEKERMRMGECI